MTLIVYNKKHVQYNNDIFNSIINGSIFVYPTDTIYGIGCNALNNEPVRRLKQLKQKPQDTCLSVIAPSLEWICQNCKISDEAKSWLDKLPGPYTLILPVKNQPVAKEVNPNLSSLGVRVPNHWISKFVNRLGIPIITTSANLHGKIVMTSLETLDEDIKGGLDFIIYEGEKIGIASQIIDLAGEKAIRIRLCRK